MKLILTSSLRSGVNLTSFVRSGLNLIIFNQFEDMNSQISQPENDTNLVVDKTKSYLHHLIFPTHRMFGFGVKRVLF